MPSPIVLLPGTTAGVGLFRPQLAEFPEARVPKWLDPRRGEPFRDYAVRFADSLDRPRLVAGVSFGGMMALEVAARLQIPCLLIASVRSSRELPDRWRLLEPAAWLGPDVLRLAAGSLARIGERLGPARSMRQLRRLAEPEAHFFRWGVCAAVRWRPSPPTRTVRVVQIHGDADDVLPVSRTRPDVVVPGGRHMLTLSHPDEVNAVIRRMINE